MEIDKWKDHKDIEFAYHTKGFIVLKQTHDTNTQLKSMLEIMRKPFPEDPAGFAKWHYGLGPEEATLICHCFKIEASIQ